MQAPEACEIGSEVYNDLYPWQLPHVFRGRDFNSTNDLFLHKLLDFTQTWIRTPDIDIDNGGKEAVFLKAQHMIVNTPSVMTSEFAQKTWMEMLADNNRLNMKIQNKPIHVNLNTINL